MYDFMRLWVQSIQKNGYFQLILVKTVKFSYRDTPFFIFKSGFLPKIHKYIRTNYLRPFISIWNLYCDHMMNSLLTNTDNLGEINICSTFNFHVQYSLPSSACTLQNSDY